MFRAKGSTTAIVGGSRWPEGNIGSEEAGFSNEIRAISGELGEVPLTKDERIWIRWPVSVFMALIYRPASLLWRPLRPLFWNPKCFVGLMMVFLFVVIPSLIISGFFAHVRPRAIQDPREQGGSAVLESLVRGITESLV